jgi:WD40 repeat protein
LNPREDRRYWRLTMVCGQIGSEKRSEPAYADEVDTRERKLPIEATVDVAAKRKPTRNVLYSRKPAAATAQKPRNNWYGHDGHRPYRTAQDRSCVSKGLGRAWTSRRISGEGYIYHVDFDDREIEHVREEARKAVPLRRHSKDPIKDLAKILKRAPSIARDLPTQLAGSGPLRLRTDLDIYNFLSDVNSHTISKAPQTLSLKKMDGGPSRERSVGMSKIQALELEGASYTGPLCSFQNPSQAFLSALEDGLALRSQWGGCAGDIITISWVSNDEFICGTTEHSDAHNQQYNRPGNLLLCSTRQGTLRAYPDHRIPRTLVDRGENSTEAMRQSQSPWLYSSVVYSDFSRENGWAYTASFDGTVKIWKVSEPGDSMKLLGSWQHDGNVNFVVVSKHEKVATAADVSVNSVRVYEINPADVSASSYKTYGHRIGGADFELEETDKWAYFPATIHWGLADQSKHHLLVGYSPRSLSTDDNDIPEERRNTGAMRLWNTLTDAEVAMSASVVQNVFAVQWHPTRPVFVVATSVPRQHPDHRIQTQIRVFALSINSSELIKFREEHYTIAHNFSLSEFYTSQQILDCFSSDINELTIRPNSLFYSYITASTTDGKVYVYDTARGDLPIHVLEHGEPTEELNHTGEREKEDVGVLFATWGRTLSRFYTGGSDGVVKVWDLQRPGNPFIRDLVEATGPVSFGAFSPHFDKLAIGDASGRVFLITNNPLDAPPDEFFKAPDGSLRLKHKHRLLIHHEEPPRPTDDSGPHIARRYLETGQLVKESDPTLGVFQGPKYQETGLFNIDSHWERDILKPLKPPLIRYQQSAKLPRRSGLRSGRIPRRVLIDERASALALQQHDRNVQDSAHLWLEPQTKDELESERCEIQSDYDLDEISDDGYMATETGVVEDEDGGISQGLPCSVTKALETPMVKSPVRSPGKPVSNGIIPQVDRYVFAANPDDSSSGSDEIPATLGNAVWNTPPLARTAAHFNGPMHGLQASVPAIEDVSDSDSEREPPSLGRNYEYLSGSDIKDVFTKMGVRIPLVQDDSEDEDFEVEGGFFYDAELSDGEMSDRR